MSRRMENFFEIQRTILDEFEKLPFYEREVFHTFTFDNRICGIAGMRGVGKTSYLLHYVLTHGGKERRALYISADNIYFVGHKLIELVDTLHKETHVRLLCIDEIHKYPNWEQELKNIYDTYLDFKIIFTGSSKIDLVHGKYDLSRRVTIYHLYGLSFREYLYFQYQIKLPIISLDQLIHQHEKLADSLKINHILPTFHEYLRIGYYPFFIKFSQDTEKFQAIENITQKTIYEDIGSLHVLKTPTLGVIEKLYKFVLNSAPGEMNANKLATALDKDFNNISTYLNYLEQAGLIRFIYPKKSGHAFLRNPAKMYPENSNMLYAAYLPIEKDNLIGKVRETFVVNQFQNARIPIYFSEKGDFQIDRYVVEVGGKNKSTEQIKHHANGFLLCDGIVAGHNNRIPLYLAGFLS